MPDIDANICKIINENVYRKKVFSDLGDQFFLENGLMQ